jgi:hypothetical protein
LADADEPALDTGKPLIDMVLVRRLDDGFAVTADEREHLHSFLHRWSLLKADLFRLVPLHSGYLKNGGKKLQAPG